MEPKHIKSTKRRGPESIIQNAITVMLEAKGWCVLNTHGNEFQFGFPDLYCMHYSYGTRWVEVKNPAGYSFTIAQRQIFPKFASKGVGIWILVEASEYEYEKLFQPANWYYFLNKSKVT